MGDVIAKKILETLLGVFKPELVFKILVGILRSLAKQTSNQLDDQIVEAVAKALGV